jgi:ATP-dependent Clp protease ATP-binding subunit ClpA
MRPTNAEGLTPEKLREMAFTDSASRVVADVLKHARQRNLVGVVSPLLVLWAILHSERRLARYIIESLDAQCALLAKDVDDALRSTALHRSAPGHHVAAQRYLDFVEVEKLVCKSRDEATLLGTWYVGTEHLLLAACRTDRDGLAVVLKEHSLGYEECRDLLMATVPPENRIGEAR